MPAVVSHPHINPPFSRGGRGCGLVCEEDCCGAQRPEAALVKQGPLSDPSPSPRLRAAQDVHTLTCRGHWPTALRGERGSVAPLPSGPGFVVLSISCSLPGCLPDPQRSGPGSAIAMSGEDTEPGAGEHDSRVCGRGCCHRSFSSVKRNAAVKGRGPVALILLGNMHSEGSWTRCSMFTVNTVPIAEIKGKCQSGRKVDSVPLQNAQEND